MNNGYHRLAYWKENLYQDKLYQNIWKKENNHANQI